MENENRALAVCNCEYLRSVLCVFCVFVRVFCALYRSDELSTFQLIFIVLSYVVPLHHCPRLGGGQGRVDKVLPGAGFSRAGQYSQKRAILGNMICVERKRYI